ncbi:MAG: TIGR03084 family metal-binding protein [Acidimicrobiales bacterium]
MAVDFTQLVGDLAAEGDELAALLEPRLAADPDTEHALTPAEGWTIADQLAHLAYFDEALLLAMNDPLQFRVVRDMAIAAGGDMAELARERHRERGGGSMLSWFQDTRGRLVSELKGADPRLRVPWYGPDMSLASAATARLMETWAHGQDVADALGAWRQPTTRLRHIADLGVRTFAFSFKVRSLAPPDVPVRVELWGPHLEEWTWGPEGADDFVQGPAEEFCLVVTQRRHLAATTLQVEGVAARAWLSIAQAFAGGPTTTSPGRAVT